MPMRHAAVGFALFIAMPARRVLDGNNQRLRRRDVSFGGSQVLPK